MLTSLKIENYALIRQLDMSPTAQYNVITGETGAGKSIMLGAVGLLLGKRADTKVLSDTTKKCIIEGAFDISAYQLVDFFTEADLDHETTTTIRREITPAGKSRAFVNDTPVNLDVLKTLGAQLIDVHSQHDTLTLADHSFQLSFIDTYAGNQELLDDYKSHYKRLTNLHKEIAELEANVSAMNKEYDYHQFLLDELTEVRLEEGEQELMEAELNVLENAEEIKQELHAASALLSTGEYSVEQSLQEARRYMHKLAELSDQYKDLADRTESNLIELKDIAREVEMSSEDVVYDPQRIEEVKERLGLIYNLQQKHQVTDITALIAVRSDLEDKVLKTSTLEDQLNDLNEELNGITEQVKKKSTVLHERRVAVFSELTTKLEGLLGGVGMPDARISIASKDIPMAISGADQISIGFSANKGVAPEPINQVASGGELSRLMFCMKSILAKRTALPTVIFDEIDTGVSGDIAMKMGKMMVDMAKSHQVITITHLPQIAAGASAHYHVYKGEEAGRATSNIRELSSDERVQEIASMIGGHQPSESAFNSAKELINM